LRAFPEAEDDFHKALQLGPSKDARYTLLLMRGILRFNQKEMQQAAEDFGSARDLKPDQYNAYLNLAQVALVRGQFDEAARQVEQALRRQPPALAVLGYHIERGRRLLKAGQYEQAVRTCDAALDLAPDHPLHHGVRAQALLELGRLEQAERAFDEYLSCGGEALPGVFEGRGLARMKLGRYAEAAEDYTRALEREPTGERYQHRGWAHFFDDAWKLALRDFERALARDPGQGDAYTGRGLALVMLGRYREAVVDAEEALRRKPETPEMMHNIACIFAQAAARVEATREESRRDTLASQYRSRALEIVRGTLRMLPTEQRRSFWRDKILPDAALAPIRGGHGLDQIEAECLPPAEGERPATERLGAVVPFLMINPEIVSYVSCGSADRSRRLRQSKLARHLLAGHEKVFRSLPPRPKRIPHPQIASVESPEIARDAPLASPLSSARSAWKPTPLPLPPDPRSA
jgi:tetratricopeptide (TPR) repeat protein